MADFNMFTDQNASPDLSAQDELDIETLIGEDADADEELEELIIEDFTIDGICGVY